MKKILVAALTVSFILTVMILVPLTSAQESGKKILRVNGAGMASDQVNKWAQEFMAKNPEISITVIGSSAGKGFQALLEGSAEICMMSRQIRPDERKKANEKGLQITEKAIGQAAIALITSPRNPINELTLEQVRKVYTGEYDNWKQVGGPDEPVRCLTRRIPESGGAVFFWEKVLGGEPFGSKTVLTETWESIIKACSQGQDLPIGIVPHTRNLVGVKLLGIKEEDTSRPRTANDENVKAQSYPIILSFSFAWDGRSSDPAIVKFLEFCRIQGGGS
jgi:phosphate transport system substrate-binding protein